MRSPSIAGVDGVEIRASYLQNSLKGRYPWMSRMCDNRPYVMRVSHMRDNRISANTDAIQVRVADFAKNE